MHKHPYGAPSEASGSRATSTPPSPAARRATAGFTLMELLVVVTIMIFITTISVMNYFGVMRAAGYSTAASSVLNTLRMARQRACLDNKPVILYLRDATNYVVQVAYGTIARIDPGPPQTTFWDCDIHTAPGTSETLLNLDQPGASATYGGVRQGSLGMSNVNASGVMETYTVPAIAYTNVSVSGTWNVGDRYGIAAFTPVTLPNGFVFDPDPAAGSVNQRIVLFNPDGTINTTDGLSTLVVKEGITGKTITFTLGADGTIR